MDMETERENFLITENFKRGRVEKSWSEVNADKDLKTIEICRKNWIGHVCVWGRRLSEEDF